MWKNAEPENKPQISLILLIVDSDLTTVVMAINLAYISGRGKQQNNIMMVGKLILLLMRR